MRILLATDDSESARCAERWIIRLATARTPHVEVVSVATSGLTRFGWAMRTDLADVGEAVEQVRLGQLRSSTSC